jgi:L-ribulose-5-phosphate 4-epimerase
MRQHGVFTIGKDARDALKAAVMCEDAAKSVAIAMQIGSPNRLPQEKIDSLFIRYQNVYGT